MDFSAPLNEVLRNSTHVRVLRALDEVPAGFAISGREVARRAGITHPSAAKALGILHEQGLVTAQRALRSDEFRLNPDHVLTSPLRQAFIQERRLVEDLRWSVRLDLERLGVKRAFLFGSIVKKTFTARSDIDLAVEPPPYVESSFANGLEALRDKVRKRYGNELSVLVRQSPSTPRSDALWRRLAKDGLAIFEDGA